jgi:hypothetical protein
MLTGKMNERIVDVYSIFLTNVYGIRLGEPVANVSVTETEDEPSCCDPDAYRAEVDTETPVNYTEFRFEVVPWLLNEKEPLSNGLLTGVVEDWIDIAFTASSGAAFHFCPSFRLAPFLLTSALMCAWIASRNPEA